MMKCPICSTDNPDNERFCRECGQRLPVSAAPPPAPPTGLSVTAAPLQASPPAGPATASNSAGLSSAAAASHPASSPSPLATSESNESPGRPVAEEPPAPVQQPPTPVVPLEQEPVAPEEVALEPIVDEPGPQPSPLMDSEVQSATPEVAEERDEAIPDLGPEAGEEAQLQLRTQELAAQAPAPTGDSPAGVEPAAPSIPETSVSTERPAIVPPAARGVRDTVSCPRCGVQNDKTFRFCKGCGSPLPPPVDTAEESDLTTVIPANTGSPNKVTETAGTGPLVGPPPAFGTPINLGPADRQEITPAVDRVPSTPESVAGTGPSPSARTQETPVRPGASLVCPICSKPGQEGESFCSECGARLVAAIASPSVSGATVCSACGGVIEPGDKFCKTCGERLPVKGQSGPRLVLASSGEQKVFSLQGGQLTIGRAPGNDIPISSDGYISSHHARVVVEDGRVYVEDAGSTNGTFLRVRNRTELTEGDEVKIGQSILRYQKS